MRRMRGMRAILPIYPLFKGVAAGGGILFLLILTAVATSQATALR
jgi:hypothetical protein